MEGGLVVLLSGRRAGEYRCDAFPATAYRMMAEGQKLRGSDIRPSFMPQKAVGRSQPLCCFAPGAVVPSAMQTLAQKKAQRVHK